MRVVVVAAIGLTGCFDPSTSGFTCEGEGLCPPGLACTSDGRCVEPGTGDVDAGNDTGGPLDCSDWDALYFDPCDLPAPSTLPPSQTMSIDTDTAVLDTGDEQTELASQVVDLPGGGEALVISTRNLELTVPSAIIATGSRPLIIADAGSINIGGAIDVSAASGGAGAGTPDACGLAAGAPGEGDAGGGGGGHGGPGGPGGEGGGDGGSPIGGVDLAGGCPGGPAGNRLGGAGGGAIWLSSPRSITVAGLINAGGQGGAGGTFSIFAEGGGAGGGAGGYVGLEAPLITVTGAVVANGGGGGGGGSEVGPGEPGDDGPIDDTAAAGGAAGTGGGNGGAGGGVPGDDADSADAAGGGGGGAAGRVRVRGQLASTGIISPRPVAP